MSDAKDTDHRHTNRLGNQTSPYLLQHAHNPVDWYSWGEEAFANARAENKPIFLSVGYSTCYWCHVMERQCFENPAIAEEMNRRFINIKVDREERADVDQLYMLAVQLMTRQGGWPMSVFLLPDLRPFYGGTYFPPSDQSGRPGFPTLLKAIDEAYRNRNAQVQESAAHLVRTLEQLAEPPAPDSPITFDSSFIDNLIEQSTTDYDSLHGGFGSAPKFPRQTLLELLLFSNRYQSDERRLNMIRHTLDALAHGGIRDQLGGAFHRYSTDEKWLVPHFEIMLYDNALLAWIYVEAYRQTEDLRYAAVARGIFDFVLSDMTSPEGAFYTAFDAEVDAREGDPYLWTEAEVRETLTAGLSNDPDAAAKINRFCHVYGLDEGSNFADPHHGAGVADRNVLFVAQPALSALSPLLDPDLRQMRNHLLKLRRTRKQPVLDSKIITGWNALMIRAMAYGGRILQERRYINAAARCAETLLSTHHTSEGGLYRNSGQDQAGIAGFLDDYAFFIVALAALHDAGASGRWKETAHMLATVMHEKFGDSERGGFFFSEAGADDLIVRQKVSSDSPLPSGNAMAARGLMSIGETELARKTLAIFAESMRENPQGMSAMIQAGVEFLRDHEPFTVSADSSDSVPGAMVGADPPEMARQAVKLVARWVSPLHLAVQINIQEGFHLNAHVARSGLLATQLAISGDAAALVEAIDYPAGHECKFAFSNETLSVYQAEAAINVRFKSAPALLTLTLMYQACTDTACLPPMTTTLDVAGGT